MLAAVYLSQAAEYFEGDKFYYTINEICNIWWWKFKNFLNPHLQHTYTLTETARCSHRPTFLPKERMYILKKSNYIPSFVKIKTGCYSDSYRV
jgi:hypothetical protein